MKDLYRILGFNDSNVSDAEIGRRLFASNSANSDIKRAHFILTNPTRKKVYDRHYRTLKMIGNLRHDFSVDSSPSWNAHSYRDFHHKARASDGRAVTMWSLGIIGFIFILWILDPTTRKPEQTPIPVARPELSDAVQQSARPSVYTPPPSNIDYKRSTPKPMEPVFDEPVLALPETGVLAKGFLGNGMAPLEIVTPSSSIDNYCIKMVNARSGNDALTFFIRSGQRVEVEMPLGTYEMRYATGKYWYGEEHLFGPATLYYRAEDRFNFRVNGTFVEGYTVELYKQIDGNLETEEIDPEDF